MTARQSRAGASSGGSASGGSVSGAGASAVSRRFVNATAERLADLHTRRLDDQRWLVVYLDGFGFGNHTLVGRRYGA